MSFHRTPAEMADDVSYARSPGCGESASRHMLWLTDADLAEIGEEPARSQKRVDFDDPASVATERRESETWKKWWGRVSVAAERRRREATSDPAWTAEYHRLLRIRQAAGPTEMAGMQAGWEAFDLEHPFRGRTEAERDEASANWTERMRLAREYGRLRRKDAEDPRLPGMLADMKARDRRNDQLHDLSNVRPTYAPSVERYLERWPDAADPVDAPRAIAA